MSQCEQHLIHPYGSSEEILHKHSAGAVLRFLRRCRNLTYPLNLPQVSIVFIFVNEALSVILRSIHSAINRTPSHLLKEIILVDDNSNNGKEHLCLILLLSKEPFSM